MILASASPRRRDLLSEYGYEFEVAPADVTEVAPEYLTPGEIVLYNARIKAQAISQLRPDQLVLGVDTVVAFRGAVFGKPANMEHAFSMLATLSGNIHEVYSGIWLTREIPKVTRGLVEVTRVKFRTLDEAQIRTYLARIEPLDKAGAYAAQNDNGEVIECVEGSLTNVVGLPMEALERLFSKVPSLLLG